MLNAKEAASLLGVHTSTLYRYLSRGLLKGTKVGGMTNHNNRRHWRISEEELKRFIEGGE